jgi:hypothetical protein
MTLPPTAIRAEQLDQRRHGLVCRLRAGGGTPARHRPPSDRDSIYGAHCQNRPPLCDAGTNCAAQLARGWPQWRRGLARIGLINRLAMVDKVIYAPPCISPSGFSIECIQGRVRMASPPMASRAFGPETMGKSVPVSACPTATAVGIGPDRVPSFRPQR